MKVSFRRVRGGVDIEIDSSWTSCEDMVKHIKNTLMPTYTITNCNDRSFGAIALGEKVIIETPMTSPLLLIAKTIFPKFDIIEEDEDDELDRKLVVEI